MGARERKNFEIQLSMAHKIDQSQRTYYLRDIINIIIYMSTQCDDFHVLSMQNAPLCFSGTCVSAAHWFCGFADKGCIFLNSYFSSFLAFQFSGNPDSGFLAFYAPWLSSCVPLFHSYHILVLSVIYYWTDAQQYGVCLLNLNHSVQDVLNFNSSWKYSIS